MAGPLLLAVQMSRPETSGSIGPLIREGLGEFGLCQCSRAETGTPCVVATERPRMGSPEGLLFGDHGHSGDLSFALPSR